MEFQEIAEAAYRNKGIDSFWSLPTKYAYLSLEKLYYKYKIGDIKKDASIKIKNEIAKEFRNNMLEYNRSLEIYKEYNQNKIYNTMFLLQIEKANSMSEMIQPLLKIVGNYVKDDTFADRNLEKLTENTLN